MFWTIVKTELQQPTRRHLTSLLLLCSILASTLVALLPQRTGNSGNTQLESFLAIQLLLAAGLALTNAIPSISPSLNLWNQRRLGPLPLSPQQVVLAQLLGHNLTWFGLWCCTIVLQALILQWITVFSVATYCLSSLLTFAAGVALIAWAHMLSAWLPMIVAMLCLCGFVALSHFLLLQASGDSALFWTGISPGVELFLLRQDDGGFGQRWPWILSLSVAIIGISNLLSSWALETWHGILAPLDPPPDRS